MRRLALWTAVAVLLVAGALYADGEPTAELSDSGIIVPIDSQQAEVVEQRVTVTLPPPPKLAPGRPATIRAEYVLRNRGRAPMQMMIGWPVSRTGYDSHAHRVGLPAVKLDGKPIAAVFLSLDDLAEAYAKEWLPRIDKLLEAKPELREQVLAARREAAGGQGTEPGRWPAAKVARWLREHEPSLRGNVLEAGFLSEGLVGVGDSVARADETVQKALMWLDPSYQYVNVAPLLAERWDRETRLLDPVSGELYDARSFTETRPSFGIFRFPIRLEPGREHRLTVQYGQFLGWVGPGHPWYGLAYVMKPAQRWGRWGRTTIEVLVPRQWRTVAIRPAAQKVGTRAGMALYRIRMGRPSENLYVSADEDRRDIVLWSWRAETFASRWWAKEQEQAAKVFLAYGRDTTTAAMRRLIEELPRDDERRFTAGFALYVLDLDQEAGRSAMTESPAPGKMEGFEDPAVLLGAAYRHHPDARLISAVLNLTPAFLEGLNLSSDVTGLLAQLAEESPGDLLTALTGKPPRVWEGTATILYWHRRGKQGEIAPYQGLEQVAADGQDPQRPEAQRLIAAVEAVRDQIRRREDGRFPLVPEGVTLPASAVKALQPRYPHWPILHTRSFDDQAVAYVREHFGDAAGPQYCRGDFDGNGLSDAAVLIVHPDLGEVRLVALRQTAGDRWTAEELVNLRSAPRSEGKPSRLLAFVTPREPGAVTYWQEQEKLGRLDLKHDGIELNYWGKASVLYYWTGSGWDKVQTGD